jgi:hypothetical protein
MLSKDTEKLKQSQIINSEVDQEIRLLPIFVFYITMRYNFTSFETIEYHSDPFNNQLIKTCPVQ